LGDEITLRMGSVERIAEIVDEFVDEFSEADFEIDLLKEHDTGIGGELVSVEVDGDGLDFAGGLGLAGWVVTVGFDVADGATIFADGAVLAADFMIHCVWSFVKNVRCNSFATWLITTF
jgi:hypothetical protein